MIFLMSSLSDLQERRGVCWMGLVYESGTAKTQPMAFRACDRVTAIHAPYVWWHGLIDTPADEGYSAYLVSLLSSVHKLPDPSASRPNAPPVVAINAMSVPMAASQKPLA